MIADLDFNVEFNKKEWELIRDAVADISCWHMGFKAANPDYEPPPQLKALTDLVSDTKSKVARVTKS